MDDERRNSFDFESRGSKVKVYFGTLRIRPCRQDTDYSFCLITFKLHISVVDDGKRNLIDFGSRCHRSRSTLPPLRGDATLCVVQFLFCYERDFMSNLHKSKQNDLIEMFNDTSRYLDDIFTIDKPEFEKDIPYIYTMELQLNKANTSDKETPFLDLSTLYDVMLWRSLLYRRSKREVPRGVRNSKVRTCTKDM